MVHFSYGMVELPNGKMKSREGTVVDADDLMAEMIKDARQTSDELGKFKDMSEEERQEISREADADTTEPAGYSRRISF